MRIVLDTNVLLSGLMVPGSGPARLVAAVRDGRLELALSEPLLAELEATLRYPRVRRRVSLSDEEIDRLVTLFALTSHWVSDLAAEITVPGDRGDDMVLATFVGSSAEVLVTGDRALLALSDRYPIMSPARFIERFQP